MREDIVSRLLRVPGDGVYAWETEESTGTLRLRIRQTASTPYYVCGGGGISVRDVHSWTERQVRDLPRGTGRSGCARPADITRTGSWAGVTRSGSDGMMDAA